MRVAFITSEYPPEIIGGAGKYAYNIVQYLAELGNEIFLILPKELAGKVSSEKCIHVVSAGPSHVRPFNILSFWLSLPGVIRTINEEYGIDVIHFNGLCSIFSGGITSVPNILTIHHPVDRYRSKSIPIERVLNFRGETGPIVPMIERRAVKNSDKIIAVSEYTKGQLIQSHGLINNKIKVIYNGINPLPPPDIDRAKALKNQYGTSGKKTILFVGRLNDRRKGLDILLKAFSLLEEIDSFILIAVGKGNQSEVRALAQELGIVRHVIFPGFIDDAELANYYAISDLFVCPSRLEGFGLTLLEAAAANLPIVATRVGGIPELVKNGLNATLVEPNPQEMASAITATLTARNDGNDQLGKMFNWNSAATQLQEEYRKALVELQTTARTC